MRPHARPFRAAAAANPVRAFASGFVWACRAGLPPVSARRRKNPQGFATALPHAFSAWGGPLGAARSLDSGLTVI
jgi:hypothetical protein